MRDPRDPGRFPVQSKTIPGGRKISYIRVGRGPHLVVLNGLFQHANGLRWLISDLSHHFTVTSLAVPGSDGSNPLPRHDLETAERLVRDSLQELGVETPIFVTISIGASLGVPYLLSSAIGEVVAYVAYEPVTRVKDAKPWWRVLYRLNHYLRKVGLGLLFIGVLWLLRAFLLCTGRRFARSVRDVPLRSFAQIGELIHTNRIHDLIVEVSRRTPTVCVLGSRESWWLIDRNSVSEVVGSMHAAFSILERSEHVLHPPHQEDLARLIVRFAREQQILD